MNVAIFGSGFGLYGYLPAFAEKGCDVFLPIRYQDKFFRRQELQPYINCVHWASDESEALEHAEAVAIIKPPQYQEKQVGFVLAAKPNIRHLFLEKPLADTPAAAKALFLKLRQVPVDVHIGYLFLYEDWLEDLRRCLSSTEKLSDVLEIRWTFMAHHFAHDLSVWKRWHEQGGGALRFYGIHLIAALAYLGYNRVGHSALSADGSFFQACFYASGFPDLNVYVDSRSDDSSFSITSKMNGLMVDSDSPFSNKKSSSEDYRIPILKKYISDHTPAEERMRQYESSLSLWEQVEKNIDMLCEGGADEENKRCRAMLQRDRKR